MSTRTPACVEKLQRMRKTLKHQEPDRIPISDGFWQGFVDNWRRQKGLPPEADINRYYDFDYLVTMPNTDPHIRDFEIIKEDTEGIEIRTGFDAVIRKIWGSQMPYWIRFETDTVDKMLAFELDAPHDERRFFAAGDHQIAGVEESFQMNIPPWIETIESTYSEFPLYGSLTEAYETLWRIVGSENALLWIAQYPDEVGDFVKRINEFCAEFAQAQLNAADGKLDGMIIWGDVAYNNGMLFSPDYWRKYFKPGLRSIIEVCHGYGIPVIYHGCGNVYEIFEDIIEIEADAINPLQVAAGMDVVELRQKYGHRIAFSGNMGVIEWAGQDYHELKKTILRKLNAAKGGGYIFQSDNAVPDTVSVERYEFAYNLVREFGRYPLELGQYDIGRSNDERTPTGG